MKYASSRAAEPMTISQPIGGSKGRPLRNHATATGGSEATVPSVTARAASARGFSEAFSIAFQAAWNTAANSTSGRTANGTNAVSPG